MDHNWNCVFCVFWTELNAWRYHDVISSGVCVYWWYGDGAAIPLRRWETHFTFTFSRRFYPKWTVHTHIHTPRAESVREQLGSSMLVSETKLRGAGRRTSNLPVTSQQALPPELSWPHASVNKPTHWQIYSHIGSVSPRIFFRPGGKSW
jgi:hypothetical protein